MNPLVLTIIISSLGLGTILTFISSHWLLVWMGLEINTLAILPLMIHQHHPRAVEASTKYFITQATASALLLFASATNAWTSGEWSLIEMINPGSATLATIALALKIGLAPLHFWLPEVLQGLNLTTGLILSTWQKLAPFAVLLQLYPSLNPNLLIFLGMLSTMVGGWGGLNQTQLRKILAYSSIAHLGWMVSILPYSYNLTQLNLILYIIMTSTTFLLFKTLNSTKINSISSSSSKSPLLSIIALMTLLSLGGLPPLSGFMPKWLILQELTKQNLIIPATVMAMTALLSLFFYLRLCYATTLTMSPAPINMLTSWRTKLSHNLILTTTASLSIFLLPITPAILMLMS
ncbi:NADH dehydrogenase subunit 2 (mitochondrion) [Carcharodon carcharias]|uniref:NADH-ubiquinone oxidoreductase chain 2 n=1 Tax=Carcharodon carcharias TaxID=13397 RepID=T1RV52_CARCH|nr:NADH dehydrogenase subunit 2 [Carcharodon carcharias]AGO90033.1 NADH dehydrogenase subunit 2 [Carcharodon carcharias]AIS74825.1 NADH dehydrogenase subunit 2 [Carcharodon carcharias]ARM57615.1 NADH dehydrogenase subunit 2 [Carcharodon carcharias]ARM57628.1 NADH dehydrogenase subunit 2 [Carcharodon carcharias]ARM57641.1 NADH dehydrogenase subunit 2 [Carcharodon carcharias]